MREQEYGKVVLRHINGKYSVTLLYYALRWNYVLQLLELSWQARICPIQIFCYLKNLQTDLATLHMQVQSHNQQPKNPVVIYLVLEYIFLWYNIWSQPTAPEPSCYLSCSSIHQIFFWVQYMCGCIYTRHKHKHDWAKPTERSSINANTQQTLIDSIKASSRIPFFTYPGGGYGKHRDILFIYRSIKLQGGLWFKIYRLRSNPSFAGKRRQETVTKG